MRNIKIRSKSIQKIQYQPSHPKMVSAENLMSMLETQRIHGAIIGKESCRTSSTANESQAQHKGQHLNSYYGLIFDNEIDGLELGEKLRHFIDETIQNMKDFDNKFPRGVEIPHRSVNLPTRKGLENSNIYSHLKAETLGKTIIFDLDETLIHCSLDKSEDLSGTVKIALNDSSTKQPTDVIYHPSFSFQRHSFLSDLTPGRFLRS